MKNLYITFLGVLLLSVSCKTMKVKEVVANRENDKAAMEKPYVILISLDGFRWDYVERFNPPNLSKFIANGVKAEALVPSFPSKTFPNHYTIATGMYPDHHGIISNNFYNYEKEAAYTIRNRVVVEDGEFYKGTPIWVLADKNEMVSASFFFVGSEADVQGVHPTYYKKYDGSIKNETRIMQAIDWLALPEKERPHIITLYFSDMDDIGHKFGPNNDAELKKKLFKLDEDLGVLFDAVASSKLPVNTVVVSDHGMAEVTLDTSIPEESIVNKAMFKLVNNGTFASVHPNENVDVATCFEYLKEKENHFKVYRTADTPGFEVTPTSPNWGALQVIPDYGYAFLSKSKISIKQKLNDTIDGAHGYNPIETAMHGIFYANGPAFKKGYTFNKVKNIHIYPLLCHILELPVPDDVDGDLKFIEGVLE